MMKHITLTLITLLLLVNTSSAQIKVLLGGVITKDSTLPTVYSPYVVQNSLVIAQGATLTIQPGTEIYFRKNAAILCYGRLIAKGSETDSILFTADDTSKPVGLYNGISVFTNFPRSTTQIQMEYCLVECAQTVINGTNGAYTESTGNIELRHCTIRRNSKVVEIPSSTRDNKDSLIVSHCSVYDNGVCFTKNKLVTVIDNSTFYNNTAAVRGANFVDNNTFYNNGLALEIDPVYQSIGHNNGNYITNNEVVYNDTGVMITYWDNDTLQQPQFFRDNKVCANRDWNIYHATATDATLYHTCFCLTDINAIKKTIRDKNFEPTAGTVTVAKINTCAPSTPPPTSIAHTSSTTGVMLYPNPTYGNTTLEYSHNSNEQYTVTIKTITGKTIYTQRNISNGKVILPTNDLPTGIYIIQLQDSKQVLATEKLVVQ